MSQGEEEANYYTEKETASVLQWRGLASLSHRSKYVKLRVCLWSIGPDPTTVTSSVHSESSVHKAISPLGNITLNKKERGGYIKFADLFSKST